MVHMILHDLSKGIPPEEIVAFTFTEKAAEELMARVHSKAKQYFPEKDLSGLYIGTIHTWCLEYVQDQTSVKYHALDELHTDTLAYRLYDRIDLDDAYDGRFIAKILKFQNDLEIFYNEHFSLSDVPERIQEPIRDYINIIHKNKLLSFGGMIRHAIELLEENGPLELQSLYVDEYQDVNPAQVELIKNMVPEDGNTTVVGDDMQCIYQWRGSDVSQIIKFEDEFPDSSVFELKTNYRSRPQIVNYANSVAEHMESGKEMKMKEFRDSTDCEIIHRLTSDGADEQAKKIADIIEKHHDRGVPYDRIAILLRSVNRDGQPIVDELEERDVPVNCPVLSRDGEIIDDLLLPIFEWLIEERDEPRDPVEKEEREAQVEALSSNAEKWFNHDDAVDRFWDAIGYWRELIDDNKNVARNIRKCLYDLLDYCGLELDSQDQGLLKGVGIASQIIRSVEEVHRQRLSGESRRSPMTITKDVYYALKWNKDEYGETYQLDESAEGVVVSTVHMAKGLEWPVVLLPNLEQDSFPVRLRKHSSSFSDDINKRYGTKMVDERRLYYVAATRARERLYLLDTVSGTPDKISAFLKETGDLLETVDVEDIPTEVWKIPEEDLEVHDDVPLMISLSDLLIYMESSYQYLLRRRANIQPSIGDELGYGDAVHELIEEEFNEDDRDLQDRIQDKRMPYVSEARERQFQNTLHERMEKLDNIGIFDSEDTETEKSIEIVMENGIVHGVVDFIETKPDGTVKLIDWKNSVHEEYLPRYKNQLLFYALALRRKGYEVSSAEIVDIKASCEEEEPVKTSIEIDDTAIDAMEEKVEEALKDISTNRFLGKVASSEIPQWREYLRQEAGNRENIFGKSL